LLEQAARIGLKPAEFWELNAREFRALLAAHAWREERRMERAAWVVSHLLAPYAKDGKPITPGQLLGRESSAEQDPEQDFDELWERLQQQREREGKPRLDA
jgi:hypothetical protein